MLQGKGNIGKPDTPGVTTQEMQRIMDEIPREVIVPAFNALIDALLSESAAADSGAEVPEGLPEDTDKTVQAVLDAIVAYIDAHKKDQKNPHAVTAKQVGAYTKEQTDKAIDEKVVEIGGGDMQQAVYDTERKRRDVFKAMPHLYKATFLLDGWSDSTQTATLTPMDGGPAVTADSVLYSGVMCEQTDVQATNEVLQDTLTVINGGDLTLGDGTLSAKIFESVTSDIEVIVQIKQGGV